MGLALLFFAAISSAGAQDEVTLRLEFKEGEREQMRFDLETTSKVELSSDAFATKQASDGHIQFTLKNACKKAGESAYVFEAIFSDLDMEQKVTVRDETFKVRIKGRNVKMEGSDGEVVVDTEKGLNPKLAEPMLKELDGFGVASDLEVDARGLHREVDARGLLKQPKKRKKMPKLLQGISSSGNLYPFVLPEKPVHVGDEWTYENELSTLGDIKLSGKPIKIPIRYRLERVEGEGASRVAVFSTKIETELLNLAASGKMEGVAGNFALKIKKRTYRGTGETRFLPSAGRAAASRIDLALDAELSAEAEDL